MKINSKYIIIILFIIVLPVFANSPLSKEFNCPIDNHKFYSYVMYSYTTYGNNLRDLQEKIFDPEVFYSSKFISCPKCHFSASEPFFYANFTEQEKKDLFKILEPYKNKKIDQLIQFEIIEKIYKSLKVNNNEIGNTFLVGSYILRGEDKRYKYDHINKSNKEQIYNFQKKAIYYFDKAINENNIFSENISVTYYLMGELYRRTGDFDNSIKYFDLVLNSKIKPVWLDKITTEQKQMSIKKDDNNDI